MSTWTSPEMSEDGTDGDVRRFESTQRLDPDAFQHAKSRVEGGYECAVEGFATDERGRVLLVCEDGRWGLPGGEVGPDQARSAALRGAVEATTGLECTVGEQVAVNDVTLTDGEHEATLSFEIYAVTMTGSIEDATPPRETITGVAYHDDLPTRTVDADGIAARRAE